MLSRKAGESSELPYMQFMSLLSNKAYLSVNVFPPRVISLYSRSVTAYLFGNFLHPV